MFKQTAIITDTAAARSLVDLKQIALMFDRTIVLQTSEGDIDGPAKEAKPFGLSHDEADWLIDQNLLCMTKDFSAELLGDAEDPPAGSDFIDKCMGYRRAALGHVCLEMKDYEGAIKAASSFAARYSASKLQSGSDAIRYVPLCYDAQFDLKKIGALISSPYGGSTSADYAQASAMVLGELPVPDEDTPWESILDFRADQETLSTYFELRNWVNATASKKLSGLEVREALESDLNKIKIKMKRLRMGYRIKRTEAIISSTIGFIENICKLRISDALNAAFTIEKTKIDLLDSEAKIAENSPYYILRAHEMFPS